MWYVAKLSLFPFCRPSLRQLTAFPIHERRTFENREQELAGKRVPVSTEEGNLSDTGPNT